MGSAIESPTRRSWLSSTAIGLVTTAGSMSGWLRALAAGAPRRPAKSVIVLWLNGGPSTIDLWDLKPGHENGGPFRPIETAVPGLHISEHLPKLAAQGAQLSVVRSVTTREGDHDRATYLLRTGYTPVSAIRFPAVGALVAQELGAETSDLPNFVSIAPASYATSLGGGFLGPGQDPLILGGSKGSLEDLKVPDLVRSVEVSDASQRSRLEILAELEQHFTTSRAAGAASSIRAATARAIRLMRPEAAAAFHLEHESAATRDAYGRGLFGQGVLLARRLVEHGVPFVEVTLDGWDTHQNNFERVRELAGTLDAAFATLLSDLADRGLLEQTLVVCQGEFGRTPRINRNTGRDHWPVAWSVVLAGGGLKTGRTVGQTTGDGMAVEQRPVSVPDLIATVAAAVGVDPRKQNMSNVGRPIRIADPSAQPIAELL